MSFFLCEEEVITLSRYLSILTSVAAAGLAWLGLGSTRLKLLSSSDQSSVRVLLLLRVPCLRVATQPSPNAFHPLPMTPSPSCSAPLSRYTEGLVGNGGDRLPKPPPCLVSPPSARLHCTALRYPRFPQCCCCYYYAKINAEFAFPFSLSRSCVRGDSGHGGRPGRCKRPGSTNAPVPPRPNRATRNNRG